MTENNKRLNEIKSMIEEWEQIPMCDVGKEALRSIKDLIDNG